MIKVNRNIYSKKAQMNQAFIFILSIIMVAFVGFLVVKFISTFIGDTDKVLENKFYDKFEKDYNSVFTTYGSEEVHKYKVTSQVRYVCFISDNGCIDTLDDAVVSMQMKEDFKLLFDANDNVIMLDNDGILNSRKIGTFIVDESQNEDSQCLCISPKNGYFELFLENNKNRVLVIESS